MRKRALNVFARAATNASRSFSAAPPESDRLYRLWKENPSSQKALEDMQEEIDSLSDNNETSKGVQPVDAKELEEVLEESEKTHRNSSFYG